VSLNVLRRPATKHHLKGRRPQPVEVVVGETFVTPSPQQVKIDVAHLSIDDRKSYIHAISFRTFPADAK
jgi:hypothetical protein